MSVVERIELAPGYVVSRLIKGGWQLSTGHSEDTSPDPVADLMAFVDAGITTFDCADIYTGVEIQIGRFVAQLRQQRGVEALAGLKIQTKFVPDLEALAGIDRHYVRRIIDRSLRRLQVERLDLVQFHWWDYEVPGMEETGALLVELQQIGKIDQLAGCNFDAIHLGDLVASGFPAIANQVQFSVLDRRPAASTACWQRLGTGLVCYGVLAGGLLSERWLSAPPPRDPLETRSLRKYLLVIEEFGGWEAFQSLLSTLHGIATRHHVSIANVAVRWVLDQPGVAAAIIGARHTRQLQDNLRTFSVCLDEHDHAAIDACIGMHDGGPHGEVFELERDRIGVHGAIMAYNLNNVAQ